jgi:hypothetical protein
VTVTDNGRSDRIAPDHRRARLSHQQSEMAFRRIAISLYLFI